MKKITILSVVFLAMLTSCKKDECDGAKVTVTNNGETQISIVTDNGNVGLHPGESFTYKLPKEAYQVSNGYFVGGSEEMQSYMTVAAPCESVEVSLP